MQEFLTSLSDIFLHDDRCFESKILLCVLTLTTVEVIQSTNSDILIFTITLCDRQETVRKTKLLLVMQKGFPKQALLVQGVDNAIHEINSRSCF